MSSEITEADIEEALSTARERYGPVLDFPPEIVEQNASALRDALVSQGLDPSDKTVQHASMVASYLCLAHVVNSFMVVGAALPLTYIQTSIFRAWWREELPVLSLADTLAVKAMEMMSPQPCGFMFEHVYGFARCQRKGAHTRHLVSVVEVSESGEAAFLTREVTDEGTE